MTHISSLLKSYAFCDEQSKIYSNIYIFSFQKASFLPLIPTRNIWIAWRAEMIFLHMCGAVITSYDEMTFILWENCLQSHNLFSSAYLHRSLCNCFIHINIHEHIFFCAVLQDYGLLHKRHRKDSVRKYCVWSLVEWFVCVVKDEVQHRALNNYPFMISVFY